MPLAPLEQRAIAALSRVPVARQEEAVQMLERYGQTMAAETRTDATYAFIGCLTDAEAQDMRTAIDEAFEQVDADG